MAWVLAAMDAARCSGTLGMGLGECTVRCGLQSMATLPDPREDLQLEEEDSEPNAKKIKTQSNEEVTSLNVLYQVDEILLNEYSMHSLNVPNWLSSSVIMAFMKTFPIPNMLVLHQNVTNQVFNGFNENIDYIFPKV